ncbi:MAG: hypothetical protein QM767_23500 [Anaeromyxobacter sp.]
MANGFDVVLWLSGTFDAGAAARLVSALKAMRPGASILIDFSEAREVSSVALAGIAAALVGRPRALLRGLTRSQWRLLGYLGLAPSAPPQEEAGPPRD